jgi:glutaredoxin
MAALPPPSHLPAAPTADIEMFVREGCPHCEEAETFLAELTRTRPELTVVIRDISREPGALDRLRELALARGSTNVRVPAIVVGDQFIVGFSPAAGTGGLILQALAGAGAATALPPGVATAPACAADGGASCDADTAAFEVRVFGRTISLDAVGLPAFTIVMGLLDGLNPCSMWVLILMISLLPAERPAAHAGHRRHLHPGGGRRLLRLPRRVAEPVPVHRAVAHLGGRARRARGGGRVHQPEGRRPCTGASRCRFPTRPSPASTPACGAS